jgi:hypothetical protein
MDASTQPGPARVREDHARLVVLESLFGRNARPVIEALRTDSVVLIRNVTPDEADGTLHQVAQHLGLLPQLEQQAAYAAFLRHRQRVGKYGMTVNPRDTYQFITPHSEGSSQSNMQLASFYCFENTTDGGETILMNIDADSPLWGSLREFVTRIQHGSRPLTPGEMKRLTALYRLHSPPGVRDDDRIVRERKSEIPGLLLADVLAVPRAIPSRILERDLYVYWDSVASTDTATVQAYVRVLRESGLLREPADGADLNRLDNAAPRRIWSSGVDHNALFRCKVTHKLTRGDLIILNNLTWAHSVANWRPESGVRNVSAAFA